MGYKAVYPEEAINGAPSVHRPLPRPTAQPGVPTPTDAEWDEFLGHFERRKRCPRRLRPSIRHPLYSRARLCSLPAPEGWTRRQRHRLIEIRDNLIARIAEAVREGWVGEVEGLRVSLAAVKDKLAQVDNAVKRRAAAVELGMPRFPELAARTVINGEPPQNIFTGCDPQ